MKAARYWRTITVDDSGVLERLLERLDAAGAPYGVIGGQAVNAYAEPLVSFERQKDLADIARLLERYPELSASLPREIRDRLLCRQERIFGAEQPCARGAAGLLVD